MKKLVLFLFLAGLVSSARGQILLTESFDAVTFPPTGWTHQFTGIYWDRLTTSVHPTGINPHSGAGMARFNSWSYSSGSANLITPALNFSIAGAKQVSFWVYRENGLYPSTNDGVEVLVNTALSLTGATSLGTIYRPMAPAPTVTTPGWYQYTYSIPASFSSATNYIIFRGITVYGNDVHLDDVVVTNLLPCSGTPTAGTITGPTPVCPTVPFTLTLTGSTVGGNVNYQWQSSPAGLGAWTNIGTNSTSYTSPGITAATDYRVTVTCTTSGSSSATTAIFTVNLNSFISCYCPSGSTSTVDDDIGQVVVGGFANPAVTPTPLTSNPTSVNTYTNFTALGPINITKGVITSFNVTQINSGGYYPCTLGIYIDMNQSGVFDASELVYTGNGVGPASPTFSGTFTIPLTANTGNTRIRFILVEGTGVTMNPCLSYTWGETEDYTVNMIAPLPCAGIPVVATATASPNPVCPNIPFTLNVGSTTTTGLGISYQWQDSAVGSPAFANITGATNTSFTVTGGITATRYYRLRVTCANSAAISYSNIVTVNLNSFYNCYCLPSAATSTADDDIGQVVVGTYANPTVTPSPLTNNPAAINTYTNFTALAPIPMAIGVSMPIQVTQFNQFGYYTCYLKVYIDYNHNSSFTDANETVYSGGGTGPASPTFTGTFTPVAGALPGLTGMRFVLVESGSATSVNPCGTYTWGESEDYLATIVGTPALSSNSPVCYGGTLTLTANYAVPGVTYNFSGPGISPSSNTTGVLNVPNVTGANAGVYSVTVTQAGITSPAGTTTVVISPQTIITAGTPVAPTICGGSNGSLQLTGLAVSTTYTINYFRNGLAQPPVVVSSNASGVATLPNLTAATYSNIVATSSAGCATNAAGPITVPSPSIPPTPSGTYNPPLCIGSTLTLTANSPVTGALYSWSGPNSFSTTGTSVNRNNLILTDSGDYSLTVTINNCVSNPGIVHVSINPPPAAPTVVNPAFCQFEVTTPLTAIGQNLKWYTNLVGGSLYPVAPTPTTFNAGVQQYFVSQTVNTCEGPRSTITVTVKPQPAIPVVASTNIEYCQFEVVQPLAATGTGIQWYFTPTGGTPVPSITPVTTVAGTSTFYVTQTVNGCESNRLPVQVTVKPKPAPPGVTSPTYRCQYEAPTPLTATGQNLLWYTTPSGGVGDPVTPVPLTGNEDTTDYYVSQTVNGCESDRALLRVIVNYRPNGIISPSREFVCENDTLSWVFFGNTRPGAQYVWSNPNPATTIESGQGTPGPVVIRFHTPGVYEIKLVINNNGCLSSDITRNMGVRIRPKITFSVKPDACIDEVVTVMLTSLTHTPPIESYEWTFDGGLVRAGSYGGGPYYVQWNTPGLKTITATATGFGCTTDPPAAQPVNVHDFAKANITSPLDNAQVCSGDSLVFTAEQETGVRYIWTPAQFFNNGGSSTGSSTWGMVTGSTIRLTAENPWGCNSMDSVVLNLQPCCDVVFPTGFTPNGDGKNDIFRAVGPGNHEIQNFRIINRWGQVVYENLNEDAGWNGTTNGVPQPMGTYFYFVRYKCATGDFYEKKGDVVLVR